MSNIAAHIERIPFNPFHWQLLMIGGLGYAFDGLDAAVVAFVLPILRTSWLLSSIQVGFLGSATYVGFFFGALFAGLIGPWLRHRSTSVPTAASSASWPCSGCRGWRASPR